MSKHLRGIPPLEQPSIYRIVGEHRSDPAQLLLLGSDGHYYLLNLHDGHAKTSPIDPEDDEWTIDFPHERGSVEDRHSA